MAEGKKKIVVYADWIDSFEDLTDEEAGKLIKHFFRYVNDLSPELDDRVLRASWIPIEKTLKRDLKKWKDVVEKRSKAGKASAESRKKNQHMLTHVESVQHNSTKSTDRDNDNDSVKEINVDLSDSNFKDRIKQGVAKYEESLFLENWETCRASLGLQTNIVKLNFNERQDFEKIKKEYTKDQINEAMKTLFLQERIPMDVMILRPKHFLEKFDTYASASGCTTIYGKKDKAS